MSSSNSSLSILTFQVVRQGHVFIKLIIVNSHLSSRQAGPCLHQTHHRQFSPFKSSGRAMSSSNSSSSILTFQIVRQGHVLIKLIIVNSHLSNRQAGPCPHQTHHCQFSPFKSSGRAMSSSNSSSSILTFQIVRQGHVLIKLIIVNSHLSNHQAGPCLHQTHHCQFSPFKSSGRAMSSSNSSLSILTFQVVRQGHVFIKLIIVNSHLSSRQAGPCLHQTHHCQFSPFKSSGRAMSSSNSSLSILTFQVVRQGHVFIKLIIVNSHLSSRQAGPCLHQTHHRHHPAPARRRQTSWLGRRCVVTWSGDPRQPAATPPDGSCTDSSATLG